VPLKDEQLELFARAGANIAQFVSFAPDGTLRFQRIRNAAETIPDPLLAIEAIFKTQRISSVNIRTFRPEKLEGNPFDYGMMDATQAVEKLHEHLSEGYFVIINETVPVNDGGFSGVLFGDLCEGASQDTPRCVDKPGCMGLPRSLAYDMIRTVYGFTLHIPYPQDYRVEFSVHPGPVGYLGEQQIVWEVKQSDNPTTVPSAPAIVWPNRYSQDMGDKAFGLLVAHLLGLPVPFTTVVGRLVPQFCFGTKQHNGELPWIRTCPREQVPGLFATSRGWVDPFSLMHEEDPSGSKIAALIIQEGLAATHSGSTLTDREANLVIEGKAGYGDAFMVGQAQAEILPERVERAVRKLYTHAREKLGDVRFEWVFDGQEAWIVQLHVGRSESYGDIIVPGDAEEYVQFSVEQGLEALRELVTIISQTKKGIILVGDVGVTSHFGDLLRKARIPSRIQRVTAPE